MINKKTLLKNKQEMLNDCWEYHKEILINEGGCSKRKADLEEFLMNCNLEGWEDVGYFVGYISALNNIIEGFK